jgi:hypothetical protein
MKCMRLAGRSPYSVGAVIGDATPGGGRADVTGVVVSQEGLDTHELRGKNGSGVGNTAIAHPSRLHRGQMSST